MSQRRILLFALGILIALIVLGVLLLDGGPDPAFTQAAPDGTVVRLMKITSGTKHRFTEGNLLERTAAPLLSDSLVKKFKINRLTADSVLYSHVFWFDIQANGTNNPLRTRNFTYQAIIRDDANGIFFAHLQTQRRSRGHDFSGLGLPAVPTGSRTLHVEVHLAPGSFDPNLGTNSPSFLALFDVPNPEYLPRSKWKEQPLPIRVQQDGFDFTLETFGPDRRQKYLRERGLLSSATPPRMEIVSTQRRPAGFTNDWVLREIRIFNERGHQLGWLLRSIDRFKAANDALLPGQFPTNSLFKLRLEFIDRQTLATHTHTFTNLLTPAAGRRNFVPLRAQVGDFTVALTELEDTCYFTATLSPPDPTRRFEPIQYPDLSPDGIYVHNLPAPADGICEGRAMVSRPTNAFALTLIWPRKKVVELIVRPQAAPAR